MSVEPILAYLRAAAASEKGAAARESLPFVTVSRQAGVGGTSLANLLAQRLSLLEGKPWRVFDRELCEEVAVDPKLSVTIESLMREIYRASFEEYVAHFILDESPQAAVVKSMLQTVRAAALTGRAVIVGRGGSLVTRGMALGVHIRLVRPRSQRVAALRDRFSFSQKQAEQECERIDASRRRLAKDYFARDIDDPLLYDAVWNVDRVPLETVADLTARLTLDRSCPLVPAP